MRLFLTTKIWQEGTHYIAYTPELDVSSQGKTLEQAEKRLREAISLFLEEAKRKGTFEEVMRDAGLLIRGRKAEMPRVSISALEVSV